MKIDRSFLRDLAHAPDDAAIVTAIIAMAHSLKLKVVAAGVQTEAPPAFLRARHCDECQGLLMSRPMVAFALGALSRQQQPVEPTLAAKRPTPTIQAVGGKFNWALKHAIFHL